MLRNLFRNLGGRRLDESLLEEWEETLVMSDVSLETTGHLIAFVREAARRGEARDDLSALLLLRQHVQDILDGAGNVSSPANAARALAQAAAQAEADAQLKAAAQAQAQAQARAEAEARARAQEQARVEAQARARAEAEAQLRAEAQARLSGISRFNPFARAKARAEISPASQATSSSSLEPEPALLAELESFAEPQAPAELESFAEPEPGDVEPAVEPQPEPQEAQLTNAELNSSPVDLRWNSGGLTVWLFVGVNGAGKTTSIGKLAAQLVRKGHKPLLIAGDTFRAAAIEQLQEWGKRAGCEVVAQQQNADPAAVVFDGLAAARARGCDVVLIDTAGRLHTKSNLMNELAKIARIVERESGVPPQETLLVIDASTGQNGLSQARAFAGSAPLSGLILTKWDGTAKGGIVLTIAHETGLPVKLLGVGEKVEDLCDFDAREWTNTMFGTHD